MGEEVGMLATWTEHRLSLKQDTAPIQALGAFPYLSKKGPLLPPVPLQS